MSTRGFARLSCRQRKNWSDQRAVYLHGANRLALCASAARLSAYSPALTPAARATIATVFRDGQSISPSTRHRWRFDRGGEIGVDLLDARETTLRIIAPQLQRGRAPVLFVEAEGRSQRDPPTRGRILRRAELQMPTGIRGRMAASGE